MILVLAEKPSMAADLARVMDPGARRGDGHLEGRRFTWTWAVGHLAALAGPEAYRPALAGRWSLDALPVIPPADGFRVVPLADRRRQLDVVRRLLDGAAEVVVATDAGREGELIWEYVRQVCGYGGPWRRLWLSETTPEAVRAAFAALRPGAAQASLAAAARARGEADWLVGMNATMALSARHGGLWSAGRVQTPTLALLVAREAEVRAFHPEDYWVVLARLRSGEVDYTAQWHRGEADRLASSREADAVVARLDGRVGRIASVETRRTQEAPPRLFNLTDLQRAANARHGMTAAATLRAAQALYEEHKALSYPRTDSRHVSPDTFATFPRRLGALAGEAADLARPLAARLPHPGRRVVDEGRVTDHHALLPTDRTPDLARLTAEQRRVYDLVARRFVAALLPSAVWAEAEAVTEVGGETLRSRSRRLATAGWRAAEPPSETRDDGPLDRLRRGAEAAVLQARAERRRTQPPKRYTEAALLRAMETAGRLVDDEALAEALRERGLGTPATRAAVIETLLRRTYARRQGRSLVPTEKGEALVALAPTELRDVATTGAWEQRLRRIETGTEPPEPFLAGIVDLTRRVVDQTRVQERARLAAGGREPVGACPRCGGAVVEGRRGFGCSRWRTEEGGCRFIVWKEVAGKRLTPGQVRELLARGETRRAVRGFRSRAGSPFAARLRLDRDSGRVSFIFDERAPAGSPARPGTGTGRDAGTRTGMAAGSEDRSRHTPATPTTRRTPATAGTPRTPATPGTQRTPATPGTRRTPAAPRTRGTPAAPGTRGTLATPGMRGTPATPGTRRTPAAPGARRTPTAPGTQRTPATPGMRGTPATPGTRRTPATPGTRRTPAAPRTRGTPTAPGTQRTSAAPGTRRTPAAPGTRGTLATPGMRGTPATPGMRGTPAAPGTQRTSATPAAPRTPKRWVPAAAPAAERAAGPAGERAVGSANAEASGPAPAAPVARATALDRAAAMAPAPKPHSSTRPATPRARPGGPPRPGSRPS